MRLFLLLLRFLATAPSFLSWHWHPHRFHLAAPPRRTAAVLRCGHDEEEDVVQIRAAGPDDLEAAVAMTIASFFGSLGDDYGFNNNRATAFYRLAEEQRNDLRRSLSAATDDVCLAATQGESGGSEEDADDRLVGFVRCSSSGMVDNLCVRNSVRRQGIARRLMHRLDEEVQDGRQISLVVDTDNNAALAFYASCGWSQMEDAFASTRYQISWWKGLESQECEQLRLLRPSATPENARDGQQKARERESL